MVQSLLAALVLVCCSFSSNAQTLGTKDCSTDGSVNFITGTTCAADPSTHLQQKQPVFDSTQNTLPNFNSGSFNSGAGANITTWRGNDELWFQHTQDTWQLSIAINQALRSAGIKIDGYSMQLEVFNKNHNTIGGNCTVAKINGLCLDVLELKVTGYDAAGNQVSLDTYDWSGLNTHNINPSASDPNWSQQNIFSWAATQLEVANVQVEIFGYDAGYWSGNYGPRVKNMVGSVIYSADICATNPLHDATCPNYVNALFNQQCTQNPLYDPSCTGYQQANTQQQCSANPLYDPSCTGYQQANLAQQCLYDPLYDVQCTGYTQAYFDQQCEMDSQYDTSCPNYQYNLVGDDNMEYNPIAEVLETPDYVTNEFVTTDVPIAELVVPTDTFAQEPEVVMQEEIQQDYAAQSLEDNIEAEIALLEAESAGGGEMNMDDNIEAELAELENETVEEEEIVLSENTIEECNPDEQECVVDEEEVSENDTEETVETEESKDGEGGDGKTNQEDDIEKEIAALKAETKTNKKIVKKEPLTKNDKIRMLLAKKADELTKKMENLATLEQQMLVQRQLLALISFVPGFDYNDKDVIDLANFYPDKPTVDHQFSRWFLNDPNFGAMEDLQYPNGFK